MIEDAAVWTAQRHEFGGRDHRIGLLGISFGGGLTLVAAGRPSVRPFAVFALSFGGHADLPRTLRYLCTGVQADGQVRPPHDYGLAIVLFAAADQSSRRRRSDGCAPRSCVPSRHHGWT